tara:strand:- start:7550 stop:8287 length:738 start_codon:yes stop_codon:yes gene_type:complete
VSDEIFPLKPFEDLGYKVKYSGQKSYNGVAIISKLDFQDCRIDFIGELKLEEVDNEYIEQKRIISAFINGVRIINVYVPNGSSLISKKFDYKLKWLELLSKYLSKQSEREELTCLLGDFNIALTNKDICDPNKYEGGIMASISEREALKNILKNKFIDTFRVFEKDSGFWSWWDYRNNSYELNKGWRIDHIYISNNLLPNLKSSVIASDQRGNEQPSDHAPIIINLNFDELFGEYDNNDDDFFEL